MGKRLSKGSVTYTYDGNNRVIKQSNGIEFIYDNSGVAGIVYNNATYVYRKDGQGNICALIDNSGNIVVKYEYDAWGNHAVLDANGAEITAATHIGNMNPYRYRGYYYDTETGLYYLKSRYYDPEVGRFINADDISYIDPETINGLNLYAYCGNNPVMYTDPNGTVKWWQWLLGLLGVVLSVVIGVVVTVASFGAASPLVGLGLATLGGAMLGFAGGFTSHVISQVKTVGFDNVDMHQAWKAGGEGFVVGAISGALSYGIGTVANRIGEGIGFALGKMKVAGMEVSKVFGSQFLMNTFGKLFGIIGGLGASFYGDYIGAKLFNRAYSISNARDSRESVMFGWMLELINWLSKIG